VPEHNKGADVTLHTYRHRTPPLVVLGVYLDFKGMGRKLRNVM